MNTKAMNTKAASILLMIFELLAVILVVFTSVSIAQAYGKSETVKKINTAEDIRMMIDTLVGVPGNALVKYPVDVSTFSFILREGSLAAYTKGDAEQLWIVRKFSLPEGYAAEGVLSGEKELCLEKKGKKILLRNCPASLLPPLP